MLCGNVLDPVVQLYKVVAYSGQIAAGGEVPALVQPHIPPVCLEVKIVDYIFGHLQPLHVLHINAPQRFIVRYAGVEVVAIQIVNEVDDVGHAGSMVALVENGLQRFQLTLIQLREQMGQMVELVQIFIFVQIVIQAQHITVKRNNENLLIPHTVHADPL